uniref:Uncharacterized protein n=1 Tax=Leptobrachium leishanense TaxID=445787 RepID=A0A8C5PK69_9ANUR
MNWWIVSVANTILFSLVSCFPSCRYYLNRRKGGVFHYDRHTRYQLTYHEAEATCQRDFGATLATREQLMAALHAGLEECRAGWITSAEVAYPRVHKHWNCGENRTGIISYGIRQNLEEKWDVFCYKEDDNCMRYESMYVAISLAKPLGSADGILRELAKSHLSQATQPESYISFTTKNIFNMWTPAQSSNSLGTDGNSFTSTNFPLQISTPNTEESIESKQENRNGSENHLHGTSKSDNSEVVTRQKTLSSSADIQVDKTISILYKNCQTNECMRPEKLQSSSTAEAVYKMFTKTSTYTPNKDDQHDSKIEFSEINRRRLTMSPEIYMKLSPSVPSSKNNLDILEKVSFLLYNEFNTSIISMSYSLKPQTNTNLSESRFEAAEDISQTHGDMASEVTVVTPLNSLVLPESSIVLTENVESVYEIHNGSLSFQKLNIAKEVSQEEPSIKTVSTMDYSNSSSHLKDSHSGRVYTIKGSESKSDLLTQNNMSPNEPSTVGSLGDISKGSKTILGTPTNDGNEDFPLNPPYMSFTMATAETHSTATMISNFKTKIDFEHRTRPKSQQLEAKDTTAALQISALSNTVLLDPTYKTDIKGISMLSHEKELFTVIVRQPETSWTQNPTLPMGETTSLSTPRRASIGQWKSTRGAMGMATPAYSQYVTTLSKVTTDSYVTKQSMQLAEEGTITFNDNPIKTLDTCGGVLHEQRGRFQSPGFPQSYASIMNCTWAIDAPPGHYITLDFISLVLEEHRNCLYDYVLVFDGTERDSKPLGR